MTPQRLYINIDHVATVRQARRTDEPDPLDAARLAEAAGADGITVHLREDRRHIQDADVERLAPVVRVLNLELATSAEVLEIACRLRPYQATIVPERREEVTTEGGLDLARPNPRLRDTIRRLDQAGARVSLFIDPDPAALDASSPSWGRRESARADSSVKLRRTRPAVVSRYSPHTADLTPPTSHSTWSHGCCVPLPAPRA